MSSLENRQWRVTLDTLQFTDLHVKFEIVRTLTQKPGTCEIDVINLNSKHRDAVHAAARTSLVRVEAGYKNETNDLTMLFQGNKRRADSKRDTVDWITTVKAGDGEHAIRTARASRAFGPNTSLEDVVRYIAAQMGVGAGNVSTALADAQLDQLGATFPEGTSVRGLAARELTELLRSSNLEWSIQEGVLQVLPRGDVLTRTAVLLSADTGLVGFPEKGANHVVTAKSLIIPELVPGRLVQYDTRALKGVYRIEAVKYTGESSGEDWYAELTTRESPRETN